MRLRIPDWLIYALLLGGFYLYARSESPQLPAPEPIDIELGEMLPEQSPRDDRVLVDIGAPESGTGTAFAVNRRGTWLTARHVVDGCDDLALYAGGRQGVKAKATISPTTDIAVLQTDWTPQPLPSDILSRKQYGQRGYFFGYPQGRPGEVVGTLVGRARMHVMNRYSTEEPVFVWAERGRTKRLRGSLGGLSGGPVLDDEGEVIGVVAAENPRRGLIYTVAPVSLREIFVDPREAPEPIASDEYHLIADRYRRERRIVQVVCLVDGA